MMELCEASPSGRFFDRLRLYIASYSHMGQLINGDIEGLYFLCLCTIVNIIGELVGLFIASSKIENAH